MFRARFLPSLLAAGLLVALLSVTPARAADPKTAPDPADLKRVMDKAYAFLKGKQGEDGSFLKRGGPGISTIVAVSLLKAGYPVDDPVVAKTLKYLEGNLAKDGSVNDPRTVNYTTSLAVVAFKDANKSGKYDKIVENAVKFLRGVQDAQGSDDKELKFGGSGYNAQSRPDVSNTAFFLEALVASGAKGDDPAFKKALTFLSKSQNLPSEFNKEEFATKASDDDKGGFVYNPSDQTNAKSTKRTSEGGLRSEGGMTYSGLKSFLYAGVGKSDPRVKAALDWVKRHYTLTENPGMGKAGLYYYYHTFAKAMDALGDDVFEDAKGGKHEWRKELFEQLKKTQAEDGSWKNSDGAFFEDQPELATAFALLALSYTSAKK